MTEIENGIALGIQSVYEAEPLETQVEKKVESKKVNDKDKVKETKKGGNYVQCAKMLQEFIDAFPYLQNYNEIEQNLKKLEEICDGRIDWLKNAIKGVKSDDIVATDEDFSQVKVQAKGLVKSIKKTLQIYDEKDVFNQKKESLNNMMNVFFNSQYKKIFEQEGLGQEFADAKTRLEKYLETKENAKKAYDAVAKKTETIKEDFNQLESEVNKQKSRLREK